MKKSPVIRATLPVGVIAAAGIAYALHLDFGGTLSSFGWANISAMCPLGALGTMLASKTVIPRVAIALALALACVFVLGRFFCGWICPVPLVSKLRSLFSSKKAPEKRDEPSARCATEREHGDMLAPLSSEEQGILQSCGHAKRSFDSRHVVLVSALGSTAVFGFPVFCLVCPIGLTFGTVFLLVNLFGSGDVSWTVIAVPALLILEVVVFRKWCHTFCPLGALMSLVGSKKILKPVADDSKCVETTTGAHCSRCARVCPEGINPRNPQLGASWNECTKCRKCIEACPTQALTMPLLANSRHGALEKRAGKNQRDAEE